MGIGDFLRGIFGGDSGADIEELARRLGTPSDALRSMEVSYKSFSIPKRSGGTRSIKAPAAPLKQLQKRILKRLLGRLKAHPAATGFERRKSIVTNARAHARRAVVLKLDIKDFFQATDARRIRAYFRKIGWNRQAAELLTKLTTFNGGLPQGAPTSPRLSNLVNFLLDARLAALAARLGAAYTRYADDITFSFPKDDPSVVRTAVRLAKLIIEDEGYALHMKKKLHVARRHKRQVVTGLVVNSRPQLPRETRRWLRAVEHHAKTGKPLSLSEGELAGWRALASMVARQAGG